MNQSTMTDDELIALLEHTMRDVARLAPDMSVDEPRSDNRWIVTAAAAVIVVAGGSGIALVASSRQDASRSGPAADAPASTSPDTSPSTDTLVPDQAVPSPWPPHATIPAVFPADVPRPDTYGSMTYITWDSEPVGWQFHERGEPSDSVERCTQYAASFGESWTSTAITDEAASVLYARYFDNTNWRVGIYCTESGDYLVQVMPASAS